MNPPRIVVLASGRGTNLQALLDATLTGRLDASIVAVVSHTPTALALERARRHGIPAHFVAPPRKHENRDDWDRHLAELIAPMQPDLVYLLGWMRILGPSFIERFPDPRRPGRSKILNLHPALPGELPGTDAILRAWDEAQDGKRRHTGVMVHVVTASLDDGPVVRFDTLPIDRDAPIEALEAAVHALEHRLVVEAAEAFFAPTDGATP